MKKYDKLIRDKIPDIIAADGKQCTVKVMEQQEYKQYLKAKLREETNEYLESAAVEELADVLEVLKSIAEVEGIEWSKVEEIRQKKADQRGRFQAKLKLLEVY